LGFQLRHRWDEGKNIQLIVNCASQISCEVRVAGDNTFEEDSINLNQHNIRYLGKLGTAEIAEQLAAASVFVLPAKYEPFGLSALEAALSGCALVLGEIESLKEIWGENAIYVDTNNASALAKAINSLMLNSDLLKEYSDKAYRHAQEYSSLSMATQYVESYRSLIRQHDYLKIRIA
jgi:glycosyltransferase involved in cell wall biosynthesis